MNEYPTFNINEDYFIHFTPLSRAKEILNSGHLLSNPPYKKFGIVGIQAISAKHGTYLPSVQSDHIETNEDIVAVVFKTNALPKIGHGEEVIWGEEIEKLTLINPKIIPKQQAINILQKGENIDTFFYTKS